MSDRALLGLPEQGRLDEATVKAAWRAAAAATHPDRYGDADKFHAAREAYERLLIEARSPQLCVECNGVGRRLLMTGWTTLTMTCSSCGGTGFERS